MGKGMYNFRGRDYEYFDDFSPVYVPKFNYKEFQEMEETIFSLNNTSFIGKLLFKQEHKNNRKRTANYFMKWASTLTNRMVNYTQSVDFVESKTG